MTDIPDNPPDVTLHPAHSAPQARCEVMFCRNCGYRLLPIDHYAGKCPHCGADLTGMI